MTTRRSPRPLPGVADERDARRKRSPSPDSLDERPPLRRRRSSTQSGDHDSSARHSARRDKHLSREPGRSRTSGKGEGRQQRERHAERHAPHHRSRSRSRSREVRRKSRRTSYSQSPSRSPPPRRRRRRSSHSERDSSLSPPRRHHRPDRRRSPTRSRSPPIRSRQPLPSQLDSFRGEVSTAPEPEKEKEKINWKTTGLLAAETNTVQVGGGGGGAPAKIVLKYNEPPDARKPPASARWRLYFFSGPDTLGDVQLSAQSCWLVGREAAVADLVLEHPSGSKQHAVVQFRYAVKQEKEKEMGVDDFLAEFGEGAAGGGGGPVREKGKVRPYLLDLESTNGTYLNGERIGDRRYVELREKDIIKFGLSEREYVVLKE